MDALESRLKCDGEPRGNKLTTTTTIYVLFLFLDDGRVCACGLVARVTWVEFGQDRGGNSLQHLLGEDTQQLPANVQRLEHGAVLVVTLEVGNRMGSDKILIKCVTKLTEITF